MVVRDPAIALEAKAPAKDIKNAAAIVWMHGLGDDASGWEGVGRQFQDVNKLPYMSWTFLNAMENMDAMQKAWYTPTPLSPFPSQRPELDDPEDEDGLKQSRKYIESVIDELVEKGIPANRIVLAGFSQGCAMSFFTGFTSEKYAGKLAGLCGLAGYMPMSDRIQELREESSLPKEPGNVPIFYMRGQRDILVPKRYFNNCVETIKALGVNEEILSYKEYEGVPHAVTAVILQDVCNWLELVLPDLERAT